VQGGAGRGGAGRSEESGRADVSARWPSTRAARRQSPLRLCRASQPHGPPFQSRRWGTI